MAVGPRPLPPSSAPLSPLPLWAAYLRLLSIPRDSLLLRDNSCLTELADNSSGRRRCPCPSCPCWSVLRPGPLYQECGAAGLLPQAAGGWQAPSSLALWKPAFLHFISLGSGRPCGSVSAQGGLASASEPCFPVQVQVSAPGWGLRDRWHPRHKPCSRSLCLGKRAWDRHLQTRVGFSTRLPYTPGLYLLPWGKHIPHTLYHRASHTDHWSKCSGLVS